ncbi:MAG: hypothetical protein ACRC46_02395 [Thermoguttaceae bacterium]
MEDDYEVVYEIFESIDDSYLLDTEDRYVAEGYYERGYSVKEHRIQKIRTTINSELTVVVTVN